MSRVDIREGLRAFDRLAADEHRMGRAEFLAFMDQRGIESMMEIFSKISQRSVSNLVHKTHRNHTPSSSAGKVRNRIKTACCSGISADRCPIYSLSRGTSKERAEERNS